MNVYQSIKPLVGTVALARGTHTAARPTAQRLSPPCWPASTCRQQLQHPPLSLASINNTFTRSKHSSTQIKRLFKKNPAKRRIALTKARGKQESLSLGTAVDATDVNNNNKKNIATAQFAPIIDNPQFLPNGWSPPPAQDNQQVKEALQKYPFRVQRTRNKPQNAVGFLPVYSEFRKDGARVTTRIKKVAGDTEAFMSELRAILQIPVPHNPHDNTVRVRTGGTIEIKGNRVREVKHWLAGLGF